jgi:hypothetical protein
VSDCGFLEKSIMSGSSWLVAGALSLGLFGAALAYLGFQARAHANDRTRTAASTARSDAARPAAEGQDVERLRGELAQMQGQLLALRARVAEQKAPEAAVATVQPEALDPETLREQREASTQRWKEHMVEVAAAFEQEVLDRDFATTTTDAVGGAIKNDPVLQKVAGKLDCRSRTCRLEIHDSKSSEVSRQLPIFLQSIGRTLRRAQADYVDGENGQKTVVLYLTNEEPVAEVPRR